MGCAASRSSRNAHIPQPCVSTHSKPPVDTSDGSHLRLGITWLGALQFTENELQYPSSYVRDQAKLGWVTELHGDELTGYDYGEAVRKWLTDTGNAHRSVCEVLLSRGHDCVSQANVFYSHMQIPNMESGQGTIGRIDQASMKFGGDAR